MSTRSVRAALSVLGIATLVACGPTSSGGSPSASPSSSASASPSPSALACTQSGPASNAWPSPDKLPQTPAITAVKVAGDVLTLTFAAGTPAFEVTPEPSARFTKDPSGQPVTLAGSAGVRIVLRGFRGDLQNYAGAGSIASAGPLLLQVYELGDSEGVVTWGAGVSAPACAAVSASGSTLTFHFIRQPAA